MMKLSQIEAVELSLGRLQAMMETETNESRRRILENVFDDFVGLVYSLYKKEFVENDFRNDEAPF